MPSFYCPNTLSMSSRLSRSGSMFVPTRQEKKANFRFFTTLGVCSPTHQALLRAPASVLRADLLDPGHPASQGGFSRGPKGFALQYCLLPPDLRWAARASSSRLCARTRRTKGRCIPDRAVAACCRNKRHCVSVGFCASISSTHAMTRSAGALVWPLPPAPSTPDACAGRHPRWCERATHSFALPRLSHSTDPPTRSSSTDRSGAKCCCSSASPASSLCASDTCSWPMNPRGSCPPSTSYTTRTAAGRCAPPPPPSSILAAALAVDERHQHGAKNSSGRFPVGSMAGTTWRLSSPVLPSSRSSLKPFFL
jgi:hypothetical protein